MIGEVMIICCVFGFVALCEKIVCFEVGLDDGVLEVVKF